MGYLSCQSPSQNDIADLVALDQRTLGGLWSAEGYQREIDSPNSCLLMLVHRPLDTERDERSLSTPSKDGANRSLGLGSAAEGLSAGDREGDLLGLGCYWAILDEAHITVLAVDPRYQRRGLGQWLLTNLLVDACDGQGLTLEDNRTLTRATLEVRPSNSRALVLYESFGFETLGRRRRYYADGEDALILWQNSLKTAKFRDQLQQRQVTASRRLERQGWQIAPKKISLDRTGNRT